MRRTRRLVACAAIAWALFTVVFLAAHRPSGEDALDQAEWLQHVRASIAAWEYHAHDDGAGLQAPNRRHGLRTWFTPQGIRVDDRTADGSPRLFELRLDRIGRASAPAPVPAGELRSEAARVEIRRVDLVEWYENRPEGLEQGFTLAAPPPGEGELVLELALDGARAVRRGDGLVFDTQAGRKLAYAKLVAWDARGEPLAAELALESPQRIAISLADAGAAYPITIDPLLTGAADSQLEANQDAASLGFSLAAGGDFDGDGFADVIVGAPDYDAGQSGEGAAFVFLGSLDGVPDAGPISAQAQLESNQVDAHMGHSVAAAGDVNGDGYADAIVGADEYDAGQLGEGAAFVFLGGPTGIVDGNPLTAATQLESNQVDAHMGQSVASAGDVNRDGFADVIVGASDYDSGQLGEGAAFVFLGGASGIADGNPITAPTFLEGNQANAFLGQSVASAGDVNGDGYADVVLGAPDYDAGQTNEGAAFVFLGGAAGVADGNPGTAHAQLESDQQGADFGRSVAGAGDVNGDGYSDLLVGAPLYDDVEVDEGAAFVFLGSASGIADATPASAATAIESNQAAAELGRSVAISGDVNGDGHADVAVGAPFYDAGQNNEGAVFVFRGGADGIADADPATAFAQLESGQELARLGRSVALGDVNGDGFADLLAGAHFYDAGNADEGAAFVYLGGSEGIVDGAPPADTQLESNQDFSGLDSVASAGDVNGDGYSDVIVGALFYDSGQSDEGAAFIFHGGPGGIANSVPASADTLLEGNQTDGWFGDGVASAGDVNGDGYSDVIVGAVVYETGSVDEGAAFIFHGGPGGIPDGSPASANTQLEGNHDNDYFGRLVAPAGDVNGDGYGDVLVLSEGYDTAEPIQGATFVYHGGPGGIPDGSGASADAQLDMAGDDAAGAGDVNGDGYADVIVSERSYENGEVAEGGAFIHLGGPAGVGDGNPATADTRLESNQAIATLGAVDGAGDVNGDGYADVIVGANQYDNGQNNEGAAFVFHGSASGIPDGDPSTAATLLEGDQDLGLLATAVAGAGDVNGDGYADVLVGAHFYDDGESDEGAAFVFPGGPDGVASGSPATAMARLESDQADARLGTSLASAGDVNGDGFADVIAACTDCEAGQTEEGAAFILLGGDGTGRPVLARQLLPGGVTPIPPWGAAPDEAFDVSLRATHPQGRGKVKLEVEWCASGAAFDDPSCGHQVSPAWTDVGATPDGVTLTESISGLAEGELYRWRARVLYGPYAVDDPDVTPADEPPHGPWRRLGGQAVFADVRTVPEPGAVASLAAGAAALAGLARRRSYRLQLTRSRAEGA